MNAAIPTAKSPDTAGCSACLRAIRHTATATPATRAMISAGCNPNATFVTTNTATGMVEATTPCTPPICASMVGSSRSRRDPSSARPRASDSGGGPGVGPWVTLLLVGIGRADLVVGVVEDLAPVPQGEPPAHTHGAPRLDAGDAAPAEPDQRDTVGAVEQLGLQRRIGVLWPEFYAAQPAEHRDLLPDCALGRALRAGLLRAGLEVVGIQLVSVTGQPAQHAAERTAIGAGHFFPKLARRPRARPDNVSQRNSHETIPAAFNGRLSGGL